MRKNRPIGLLGIYCGFVLLLCPTLTKAGDYDSKDFSLRLPAAISRFSSYGDVAGAGGASAASKWASSVNPASAAWLAIPTRFRISINPQYSAICFSNGSRFHVFTESLTWESKNLGTFQPAMTQLRSNKKTTRQGLEFEYDMDYFQIQWGKRLGEKWTFGANFNYAKSETRFNLGPFDVSETDADSYGFRVGALVEPFDHLLFGLVFDYGFSLSRTTMRIPTAMGIAKLKASDTTHQYLLRPGISYEYAEDSAVYFDYQFGSFSNDTGRLNVHRFMAGVDHRIFKWLFVRGGMMADSKGNPAWTAGVGVYPTDWLTIDIAYQDKVFPELEMDFGRARAVMLSVGIQF